MCFLLKFFLGVTYLLWARLLLFWLISTSKHFILQIIWIKLLVSGFFLLREHFLWDICLFEPIIAINLACLALDAFDILSARLISSPSWHRSWLTLLLTIVFTFIFTIPCYSSQKVHLIPKFTACNSYLFSCLFSCLLSVSLFILPFHSNFW